MRGYGAGMTESQRNLLILVAIAAIGVAFSGAFNLGAGALATVLNVAFTVMIVAAIAIVYRRHSGTIARMPATPRLVLQASALGLGAVVVTGTFQVAGLLPWPFGWANAYPVPFYGAIFAFAFGIWWAWQQRVDRW